MKPAQAGALTTPLPESCRAASSARTLWSAVLLAESAAFVAYEASSVASALAPWSAVMLASRLASCAATKVSVARPSRAFAILVSTSSGSPSTVESREASALASALPRRAASRAAVVTASRRVAGEIGHCFVVGARHQLRASMSAGWRLCRAGSPKLLTVVPQDNWKNFSQRLSA